MPIEYAIADGIVWVRAHGALDDAMLLEHARALSADPNHGPGVPELFDASEITALRLTGPGLREVAALMRHAPGEPSARLAVVVNSTVAFGMGRMYELLREDIEVMVFSERSQAEAWLRADPTAGDGSA